MSQGAGWGKRMRRPDQIVAVAERLLDNDGVAVDELLAALKASGVHRAEHGEVWETLKVRGVAEMVGDRFVRKGAAAEGAAVGSDGPAIWTPASLPSVEARPGSASARADVPGRHEPPARTTRTMHPEAKRLRSSLLIAPLREEQQVTPVPAAWPSRARELAWAVQEELRESTSRRNLQDVPVSEGEWVAATESRVLYRFDVQGELPSGEGASVTFLPDGGDLGEHHEAEIISVFGSDVTLALPPETPAVRSGRIRCDLTWLLVSQQKRLREVEAGAEGFHSEAALSLTEADRRSGRDVTEIPAVKGLNAEQSRAVAQARRYGTTWLWGPPGTGKTTTVAAIVEKLVVEDECRVLLVAPTNVAVDVALGAVLRRLSSRTPGLVVRLGPPVDPTLMDHPEGRILADEVAADRGSEVAARRVEVGREIASLRQSLKKLREAKSPDAAGSRRGLEAAIADKQALARDLDGLLRDLRRQVCRDAGLVAATTHQVLLGALKGLPFDVVIIDEGSMVSTSLAALVAGSGRGHTIVAGDFRQLPPVTQSEAPEVLRWLRRSPFESCGVDKGVRVGEPVAGLVPLKEQHRMRQHVSDMVSTAFYPDSPLVTAESVLNRSATEAPPGWPSDPVVLIDTSSLRARVSRRQGQWSRLNIAHAQIGAAITARLSEGGIDLALISPFAPQAKLLAALAGPTTRASTVHRYQGSEAETVVFDAVDTQASVGKLHPWFAEGELGSDGSRLVNVAASRARDQFVLLADMRRVLRASSTDAVSTFLRQVDRQSVAMAWRDAIDGTATREEFGPMAALVQALEDPGEVEMFLPEADLGRVRALLKHLDPFRLVDATLWLTPTDAQGESGRLLATAGAYVRPLGPIPESVVVVGDTVMTASRSVLSASPGIVLVTTHQEFANVVRRVVRRRGTATCPGSGEPGHRCGGCRDLLIRTESAHSGPRYRCSSCGD